VFLALIGASPTKFSYVWQIFASMNAAQFNCAGNELLLDYSPFIIVSCPAWIMKQQSSHKHGLPFGTLQIVSKLHNQSCRSENAFQV
jgi:hypothetical protein